MVVSKTSDYFQFKIKIPTPSHEPPVSSKSPNQDLKDMVVLCTFKIKIESQNLEHDNDAQPQPILKGQDVLCSFKIHKYRKKPEDGLIKDQWP